MTPTKRKKPPVAESIKVPLVNIPKPVYNEIEIIPEDFKKLEAAEIQHKYILSLRRNNELSCRVALLEYEAAKTKWEHNIPKFKEDDAKLASQQKTADDAYFSVVDELEKRYQFKFDEYTYDKHFRFIRRK